MREHCCKEIRERLPAKTRRWRRAIHSAPSKVVQDHPQLVSPPGQAPMVMVHVGQIPMVPFHGRGGPLQALRSRHSSRLPGRQHCEDAPLGAIVLVQGGAPASQTAGILAFRRRQCVRAT